MLTLFVDSRPLEGVGRIPELEEPVHVFEDGLLDFKLCDEIVPLLGDDSCLFLEELRVFIELLEDLHCFPWTESSDVLKEVSEMRLNCEHVDFNAC